MWAIGIGANAGVIIVIVLSAHESRGGASRAALLGTAGGASFGLTAAFMKAMTGALNRGFGSIFLTWQTYAMVVAGAGAMFLLQSALNAGSLVAAQPGLTTTDPVVSILWGTLAFGETVRGGWYLAIAVAAAAAIGWGVFQLSRSPLVAAGDEDGGGNGSGERAQQHRKGPARTTGGEPG